MRWTRDLGVARVSGPDGNDMPSLDPELFTTSRPGQWFSDGLHGPRPYTPIGAQCFGDPIEAGSRAGAARYGMLSDGIGVEFMQRFEYIHPRPLMRRPAAAGRPTSSIGTRSDALG